MKFVKRIKLACYSLLFWSLRTKGIWKFPCWINLFSLTSPLPFRCSLRFRSVAMMSTLLEVLFGLINLPKTESMLSVEFYCIKMKRFSEDFQPNEDAKHTLRQKVALDKFFLWLFYLLYFISLFRLCILYPYSFHKEFRIAYKNMSIQNK